MYQCSEGGTSYPVLVNSYASLVEFINPNQPLRPRVVPTGDPDVFSMLWSSANSTDPLLFWGQFRSSLLSPLHSFTFLGESTNDYVNVVKATTSRFTRSDLCGAPANTIGWRDPGLTHTASFVGMTALAGKKLYYKFGDAATDNYSKCVSSIYSCMHSCIHAFIYCQ